MTEAIMIEKSSVEQTIRDDKDTSLENTADLKLQVCIFLFLNQNICCGY